MGNRQMRVTTDLKAFELDIGACIKVSLCYNFSSRPVQVCVCVCVDGYNLMLRQFASISACCSYTAMRPTLQRAACAILSFLGTAKKNLRKLMSGLHVTFGHI